MSKDKAAEPTQATTEPAAATEPAAVPDVSKVVEGVMSKIVSLEGTLTTLTQGQEKLEKKLSKAQGFIKEQAEKGNPDATKAVEEAERQRAQEIIDAKEAENLKLKADLHRHLVVNEVKREIGGKFSSSAFAVGALEAAITKHASRDEATGKIVFKDDNGNVMYRNDTMIPMSSEDFGSYLAAQMKEIALSDAVSGPGRSGSPTSTPGTGGAAEPPPGLSKSQLIEWYQKNTQSARVPSM